MKNDAFTMVELLVALAIVGVLAAVAVPNYKTYTARAHQTEAKTAIGGVFTAEKNYSIQQSNFTSCLSSIGIAPMSPTTYYAFGIAASPAGASVCGVNGSSPCDMSGGVSCAATVGSVAASGATQNFANEFGATARAQPTGLGWPAEANFPVASTGAGVQNFSAAAVGNISARSGAAFDIWQINGSGTITQLQSGL